MVGLEKDRLEKALGSILSVSEVHQLAKVLAYVSRTGRISYREVERITKRDPEEILFLAIEWRLLLPVRTSKSIAWEDRVFLTLPGEIYEMPRVVRYLVENASCTGRWNPKYAVTEVFKAMGDPAHEQMFSLVERLEEEAQDHRVNAVQIKKVCNELGLDDRVDPLIAELKGSGVMSPKMGSISELAKISTPIYELNPSLKTKKMDQKRCGK